ncbi:FAD-dependent monooxygenase [Rhizobium beringeri]
MREHAVVVVGAGPTGLMLAGELALAGVDVAIVERRPNQELAGTRAGGLSARTLEVLDQRGIVDRFLAEGQIAQVTGFAVTRLDISDFPTRHNYGLALRQKHIERILAAWVGELAVPIYRSLEVTGFAQDDTGVTLELSDASQLRAGYLVGCDGGRSLVPQGCRHRISRMGSDDRQHSRRSGDGRRAAIGHPSYGPFGIYAFGREEYEIHDGKIVFAKEGPIGLMVPEKNAGATTEPTLGDLKEALITAFGTDYGLHRVNWISRFTDISRQATAYRKGRVFLAGDAAHVHSPVGGQGLNTGVQDAVNLGWKLAQVVKGTSPDALLDTYHAERHPVAARVLRTTMAQVALQRTDDRTEPLRDIVTELLGMEEPRKRIAAEMSGLGIHYDLGDGHPLLGRRMPDLDLVTSDGPVRVFALLRDARPILLNLGAPGSLDIASWSDRITLVDARYDGAFELPALGVVSAPTALLIRPDGYVAWVGDRTQDGLQKAMNTWFGPPG